MVETFNGAKDLAACALQRSQAMRILSMMGSSLSFVVTMFVARLANAQSPPPPQIPLPPPEATQPQPQPQPPPQPPAQPPPLDPSSSSSIKMTYEATHVDRPNAAPDKKSVDDSTILHGFRLGYGYVMNYDRPVTAFDGKSLKDVTKMRSPSHFLLGYELLYRVVSHSWLNVLLLGNGMIAGIEQSKFLPSANLLIGAEIKNSFQIGVGANISPLEGSEAHFIAAAGWTPRVGSIYTPFHFFFIPDVDGVHRMGVTTGVTF